MKISYKDVKLFYKEEGSGPATVLLHGFLENHRMWDGLMNQALKANRCIYIDLPGHGESDVLPGINDMKAMAAAVKFIIQSLNVTTAKFIGHSMGGYVALAFSKKYPALTAGVFLMNSTPISDSASRKELRKHGIKVAKKNYEALVKMSVTNLFSDKYRESLREEIEKTKSQALGTRLEGYIASQYGMMAREDHSEFWKTATFKRAMLLGEQDGLIPAWELKHRYASHQVDITIVDGGHMSHLENPKETKKAISAFLSDC